MTDTGLMTEGLTLMGYGMGFVFVFLTLLVFSTKLMSAIVLRLSPLPDRVPTISGNASAPVHQITQDARLMAILAVAVHQYRRDRST